MVADGADFVPFRVSRRYPHLPAQGSDFLSGDVRAGHVVPVCVVGEAVVVTVSGAGLCLGLGLSRCIRHGPSPLAMG